jgi:predicted transcriptional regulator
MWMLGGPDMTKLLEEAIEKIRHLPEADQDDAAELLLILALRASAPEKLDDVTRAAIREGLAQARRGEFATDDEIAAIFGFDHRGE